MTSVKIRENVCSGSCTCAILWALMGATRLACCVACEWRSYCSEWNGQASCDTRIASEPPDPESLHQRPAVPLAWQGWRQATVPQASQYSP